MNNMREDLVARFDSRKSFYGKAKVERRDGNLYLYSYGTLVAKIVDGQAYVFGLYSQTTTRHIKEFLKQNCFRADNSKQILRDYGEECQYEYIICNFNNY